MEPLPQYETNEPPRAAKSKHLEVQLDAAQDGYRYRPGETLKLLVKRDESIKSVRVILHGQVNCVPYEAMRAEHHHLVRTVDHSFTNEEVAPIEIEIPEAASCAECGQGPFPTPTSLVLAETQDGHGGALADEAGFAGYVKIKYSLKLEGHRKGVLKRDDDLKLHIDIAAPKPRVDSWRRSKLTQISKVLDKSPAVLETAELSYRFHVEGERAIIEWQLELGLAKPAALDSPAPVTSLLSGSALRMIVARKLQPKPQGTSPSMTLEFVGNTRGPIETLREDDDSLIRGARVSGSIQVYASSVQPFDTCLAELQYLLLARMTSIDTTVWLVMFRPEASLPAYVQ